MFVEPDDRIKVTYIVFHSQNWGYTKDIRQIERVFEDEDNVPRLHGGHNLRLSAIIINKMVSTFLLGSNAEEFAERIIGVRLNLNILSIQ
jgi:hypothetical protein